MIIGDLGKLALLNKILQTSFLYFLSHYFKLVNIDNVILDQNIQFKCSFSFDLCIDSTIVESMIYATAYSKRDI